jgi:hypothetical protein
VPVTPPQPTIDRYLKAIDSGDADAAYALLSAEHRAHVSASQFRARFEDTRAEVIERTERIRRTGTAVEAEATVELDNGDTVKLALEDGQWRIAAGLLDASALRTPVDAVQTLRRVLLRRDLAGLLSLLTREERANWEATFGRIIESTADPLDWETQIDGDEAIVRTTGGGVIVLRREAGRWRVHDIREAAP